LTENSLFLNEERQDRNRRVDAFEERLWEWRHQMEQDLSQRHAELEQQLTKIGSEGRVAVGNQGFEPQSPSSVDSNLLKCVSEIHDLNTQGEMLKSLKMRLDTKEDNWHCIAAHLERLNLESELKSIHQTLAEESKQRLAHTEQLAVMSKSLNDQEEAFIELFVAHESKIQQLGDLNVQEIYQQLNGILLQIVEQEGKIQRLGDQHSNLAEKVGKHDVQLDRADDTVCAQQYGKAAQRIQAVSYKSYTLKHLIERCQEKMDGLHARTNNLPDFTHTSKFPSNPESFNRVAADFQKRVNEVHNHNHKQHSHKEMETLIQMKIAEMNF